MAQNIQDLSVIDNNNQNQWPEGTMKVQDVNDAGRADEGIMARWFADWNGSKITGGTGSAYTLSSDTVPTAYYDGFQVVCEINVDCLADATLNVDSLGAATIKKNGTENLLAGDLRAGMVALFVYRGTDWNLVSAVGQQVNVQRQIFTTSGTFNKSTLAASVTHIIVEVVGGGGGGGGSAATGAGGAAAGAGGGAGGYCSLRIAVSALASSETVTIGAGGDGGVGDANGSVGGDSSFGTFATGSGGNGGGRGTARSGDDQAATQGGFGGAATGGDINARGGPGTSGHPNTLAGTGVGGSGGNSFFAGGGGGVTAAATPSAGEAGQLGSGGSGSSAGPNAVAGNGASGGSGIVIVNW